MYLILSDANTGIINILGYQKYDKTKEYIEAPFLEKVFDKRNYGIFNLLTEEKIIVNDYEPEDEEFLISHWYKIPKDLTVDELYSRLKACNKSQNNKNNYNLLKTINSIIVFTTLGCNANCSYCYEKEQKFAKEKMTEETADKIIKLLLDYNRTEILWDWFGGEPLVNSQIIDYICQRCKEENIKYSSGMISNGILFDEESVKKAKEFWKLGNIQITLDGTYDYYDQVKQVPSGTFQRVINNIILLLKAGIYVSVRLNVTEYNIKELKKVVYLLNQVIEPEYRKDFNINTHEIFGTEHLETIYRGMIEIDDLIGSLFNKDSNMCVWTETCCMADRGEGITVLPNGDISICEHCIDHDILTNLSQDFYNIDVINKYTEVAEYDYCKGCKFRVCCNFLVKCAPHGGNNCSEFRKQYISYNKKKELSKTIDTMRKRRNFMVLRKMYSNLQIYNMATALIGAFQSSGEDTNYPVKVNFYLQKNMNSVIEIAKDIEAKRVEIIKKYGNPSEEDPEAYIIPDENIEVASKEVNDLLELEQEVAINMIKLDWLDGIDMSAAQVAAMSFMIDEDEE